MENRIYVRACMIVVQNDRLLMVPHFDTDRGPVQYNIPGGEVEFGEGLEAAALREFEEETGLVARSYGLFDVYELHKPDWHSITVAYSGEVVGGTIKAEMTRWGQREPRWMSADDLQGVPYHPIPLVEKALSL